jgi:hypothetical protein
MADNINVTPGVGAVIAADEIAGALHQRIKLTLGADGSNDGDVSSSNPLPISLPSGASTSALQTTGNSSLASLDGKAPNLGQATMVASVPVVIASNQTSIPSSQSGSWTVVADAGSGTFNVSASTLPLPSGAATSALQTSGNASLTSIDNKTPALGQALAAASVPVVLTSSQLSTLTPLSSVSVSNFPATQAVSAVSLPLPSGAATSALQTTGNTSLSSIDVKTPSLGQALSSASVPVVLPAAQLTTLTPLSTVTVTQATGTNLHTVIDSLPSLPTGSNAIGSVSVSNFPATQPISGTVTANAGTNLNTSALNLESTQSAINVKIPSNLTVTANRLQVDGSGVTQPVSASSLPLPSGASTEATLSALNVKVTAVNTGAVTVSTALPTGTNSIGQVTANAGTGSFTVAQSTASNLNATVSIAAAQTLSAVTTLGSITNPLPTGSNTIGSISNISGTVSLPTGASTSALQTTGNTSLSSIVTNTTGLIVSQASTTAGQSGQLQMGAVTTAAPAYTTAQTSPLSLTTTGLLRSESNPIAITKGTQGTTGFMVQDLHDAGRVVTNYFTAGQVLSTVTDTLLSLTGYKNNAAVAATTTPAVVTATKFYRITQIVVTHVAVAAIGSIQISLRANTAGVVAIGSPLVNSWLVGSRVATAGTSHVMILTLPEGLIFSAGTGIGISLLGVNATGVAAAAGHAKVSILGYEY